MITGAHFLLYSKEPDKDRAFFRDVLDFPAVDVGHGWLIFGLPASELAVHPSDGSFVQKHNGDDVLGVVLYLMCDDVRQTVEVLVTKRVACTPIEEAPWGRFALITLPSGGKIGLYQPSHPTALNLR
jgi:predicted enzyme related to lactoylglutathione lyase